MVDYKILCEVVKVEGEGGVCPGPAKTKLGSRFILSAVTPGGMCARAYAAIAATALAMRFSESLPWEHGEVYFETPCPDSNVVYRLSRIRETKP